MGLGPAGLTPEDGPILVARLLQRSAEDIYSMATGPAAFAKQMVWAMLEETWRSEDGEALDRPNRPGAVGTRGPARWDRRALRALSAACDLDGAPLDPLMAVRPDHLPAPIPNARPSMVEINRKYGKLLEHQITTAQQLLDRGED
eukprot:1125035-Alexandrium_andersonii.AAC.1